MSRGLRIALSAALSAVFLAVAVRGVDWREAGRALAQARYWTVLPMVGIVWWTLLIRAQRWRLFLRPLGQPRMRTLTAAVNIGFMCNMVLPLRAGEVIRPVLASRRERLAIGGVLATVVLERIFDMFTVLFLFGVAVAFVPVSERVRAWGLRVTALALVIGGGVALLRWQEERTLALMRAALRPLPARAAAAVDGFAAGFVQALEVLDSPASFLRALAWSIYMWLVIASLYSVAFFTFGMPAPVILGGITVSSILAIAVSVPSAPGFIGSFQLGCILSLALFGVDESRAIAYSIVTHLVQFVAVVAAGLYSLSSEGMSLREIEAVSEAPDVAT